MNRERKFGHDENISLLVAINRNGGEIVPTLKNGDLFF